MHADELQSKTIDFLRFPLCVGVVLLHSDLFKLVVGGGKLIGNQEDFPVYHNFSYFLSEVSSMAVPLFFFISGFLFFRVKAERFDRQTWWAKIKKRTRTLLAPYIFWNLLALLLVVAGQVFFADMISGRKKPIADYGLCDWFSSFWAIGDTGEAAKAPINRPLWFLRDLMVMALLSPLIHLWIKKLRVYGVVLLGILWLPSFSWNDVPGFSRTALFFFSAGAWFGINKKNFVSCLKPYMKGGIIAYAITLLVMTYDKGESGEWTVYLHRFGILAGIVSAVTTSAYFLNRETWKVNTFLAGSSFFIYAYHDCMVRSFVQRVVFKLVQPQTELSVICVYLACPAIIIGIGLSLYYALRRWFPMLAGIVSGGR